LGISDRETGSFIFQTRPNVRGDFRRSESSLEHPDVVGWDELAFESRKNVLATDEVGHASAGIRHLGTLQRQ
jgi:hypothetical protein